jgi:hypothetical protein
VGLTPVTSDVGVSKRVFDQLQNDGLIEKESESSVSILYKLRKSKE